MNSNASSRFQDRRLTPRKRRGVRVLFLSNDSVVEEPFAGTLLDMSSGGVRLAIRLSGLVQGALLMIRPPAAPAGTRWVPVQVRNLRLLRDHCEVGCEFTRPQPPKTLGLFAS